MWHIAQPSKFAKWAGFSPIIATASLHNTELIKSYGATHVIDRTLSTEKIIQEIKATTGGTVDIVYDAVTSEETVALGIEALREGGTLLVVLYHLDEFIKERSAPKKLLNVTARGIMTLPGNVGVLADLYAKLPETLERGIIRVIFFLSPARSHCFGSLSASILHSRCPTRCCRMGW